jgi:hypothetical protein
MAITHTLSLLNRWGQIRLIFDYAGWGIIIWTDACS